MKFIDVKVATVDSFQGQESDIVIISTTRTNSFGFVINARRINVSLSRAKFACFIVGNKKIFESNTHWKNLLNYITQGKSMFNISDKAKWNEVIQTIIKNI